MKFIIHFQWPNGTDDSICLEGETIAEIQGKAATEMASRGVNEDTCWSEEIG